MYNNKQPRAIQKHIASVPDSWAIYVNLECNNL